MSNNTAKSKTIARAAETAKPVRPAAAHQNVQGPVIAKKDATTKLIQQATIQPKLKMGSVGDAHEQQADAMAEKVVRTTDAELNTPAFQRTRANAPRVQAKQIDRKLMPVVPALVQSKAQVGTLMKKGNDEQSAAAEQKKGNDEKLQKKGNDEQLKKKGNDEKLNKKGNDEKEVKKKGNDEKEVKKKGNDEKLNKKGNDEKEVKKKGNDEQSAAAEQKKTILPKVQLKPVQLKPIVSPKLVAPKEEKKQEVQKKILLKAQPVTVVAPKLVSLKEEKKLDKKGNDEKVEKPIQKKVMLKEQAPVVVAPKNISLKEEKKLDKKGNDEKIEKPIQKKIQAKENASATIIAPKIISLKEEKKLDKKGNDEKVEKPIQKKIQPKENALRSQTPLSVAATIIAPKIVSLKEEKKLDKKGNDEKVEKPIQKKIQAKENAPATIIAPKIISLKEEKKLDKKGNDEKVEKPIQKKIQPKESALRSQTPLSVAAPVIAPKIISLKEEKKLDKKGNDEKEQHLQREAAATAEQAHNEVSPEFENRLNAAASGGRALDAETRSWMEARFQVGFSQVRIHTDHTAVELCNEIGAQAFAYGAHIFFNAGKYNPRSEQGKFLLAHELTHVIQQGFSDDAADVQRAEEKKPQLKINSSSTTVQAKPTPAAPQIQRAPEGVTPAPRSVQRSIFDRVRSGLAALAANIPGYTLLTVLIGYNPILGQSVQRNITNILRGFMGLIPGGEILYQVLSRYGVIDQIGTWVSTQAEALGISSQSIQQAFTRFVGSLGLSDVFSPSGVWERARSIFTEPINRLRNFVSALTRQAIVWLKEKFMQPISAFCREIPGYTLFTVMLGRDPFTGVAVPTTAMNVMRAVAEFIPGGAEKFQQLQESRALERAYAWFTTETRARNLTWERISSTFTQVWNSLSLESVMHPIDTIRNVSNIARPLMVDLVGFAGACLEKLLELIYEAAMGAGGTRILTILKRSRATFLTIVRNPVGFLGNLVRAVGLGVRNFAGNILRHLQTGAITWLTGALGNVGLELPRTWDLRGFLFLAQQILGLTWPRIRERAVTVFGEPVVSRLETGFQFLMDVRERGLVGALRDRVTEFFGNLRERILGSIKTFIQERIVMSGIQYLLSLLTPVGAVIQAVIKTYQSIMFFIEKINQILDFVESIVNSISNIANGSLGQAAAYVEQTMARTIPLILDFLARMINLGGISQKIRDAIAMAQAYVSEKLLQVFAWIRRQAVRLIQAGRDAAGRFMNWLGLRKSFRDPDGSEHNVIVSQRGGEPFLVVRSQEKPFDQLILARRTELATDTSPTASNKNQALTDAENEKKNVFDKKIKAYKDGLFGNDFSQSAGQKLLGEINISIANISNFLSVAGVVSSTITDLRPTVIKTPIIQSDNRAGTVIAEPLTYIPGGGQTGSSPSQDPPGFTELSTKYGVPVGKWVRGHLLYGRLHGPGLAWNLAPMTRRTNNLMEEWVEGNAGTTVWSNRTKEYYYETSITYYPADTSDPDIHKYPKLIDVKWGELQNGPPSGPKPRNTTTQKGKVFEQEKPPSITLSVASYNQSTPSELYNAVAPSSPKRLFKTVVDIRTALPNQRFTDINDVIDKVSGVVSTAEQGKLRNYNEIIPPLTVPKIKMDSI